MRFFPALLNQERYLELAHEDISLYISSNDDKEPSIGIFQDLECEFNSMHI